MNKLLNRIFLGLAVFFLLSYGVFSYLQSDYFYEHEKSLLKFNQKKWLSSNTSSHGQTSNEIPRRRMVNDLIENHLKVGMARNEIETLIGKGDESFENNSVAIYYLGFPTFQFTFSIDVLKITYSNNISIDFLVYKS